MRKRPLKIRRESGRKYFDSSYYDEEGNKINYIRIQWDDWEDYRDGFRNPIGKWYPKYDPHPPSWKHRFKKVKQYEKTKERYYNGCKRS